MYIVLGVPYVWELYSPLPNLFALPWAAIHTLLALNIVSASLDFIDVIGIVLLIGIVKNSAIMLIMTTVAAIFGAPSPTLGSGVASEPQYRLGPAVDGPVVGRVLTPFMTPVLYLFLERTGVALGFSASRGIVAAEAP